MLKLLRKHLIKIKNLYRKTFNPPEKEINFDSFFKFPLLFLRLVQFDLQPLSQSASLRLKIKHFARLCYNIFRFVSCILVPLQFIAFGVAHSDILDIVVRAFSDSLTVILMMLKGLIIFQREDDIRKILDELKMLDKKWNNAIKPNEKRKYLDGYHRVVKFYFGIFISANLIFVILWFPYLLTGRIIYLANLWFPFDEYRLEMFPYVQIWIQWITYLFISVFMTSDLLLYSLITVISMEFDFLKNSMNFFLKSDSKDERMTKITSFIERHNKLLELCDKLQQIFEPIFLFNFVISSVIMCIVLYNFLFCATSLVLYTFDIVYFVTISSQIWLFCYFGQKVINSSFAIADGIYDQDWMDLDDNKFKKYVVLIILRAQRPMRLSAMGFADISLETFATVRYLSQNIK